MRKKQDRKRLTSLLLVSIKARMTFQLRKLLKYPRYSNKMWRYSGRDNTINFHLDTDGSMHSKGEVISKREANFARDLFDRIEDITGLRFKETNYMKSDIAIGCTDGSKWDQKTNDEKYWFESYYEDYGGSKLTEYEKLNIAACVLRPLGLAYVDNGKYDTFDTVMSWKGNNYYGLRPADIDALRELW